MIRVLHLADIHPLSKGTIAGKAAIDPVSGMSLSLEDARRSLEFAYQVSVVDPETQCDIALLSGDIFDSDKPTMDEVSVITEFLVKLSDAMSVMIIPGNHDLNISGQSASALTPLIHRGIHIFESPQSHVELLHPQSPSGWPLRIDCLPYPSNGRLLANQPELAGASPEEITEQINRRLKMIMAGLQVEHKPGEIKILMAHGSVSGVTVGEQPRSLSHDILIPRDCFEAYDYVALGHIHQPQQVAPNAWYSGSLLRQNFGEEGEPKGFNIVEIAGPGEVPRVQHIKNPYARTYQTITLATVSPYGLIQSGLDEVRANPETVWRIKDRVTEDDYATHKGLIREFQGSAPFSQIDIEIIRPDRMRDAGMTELLGPDDALRRALEGKVPDEEVGAVLEKHQALTHEVEQ